MSKASERYHSAARHHELAAYHYKEAAKYNEAEEHEKAAHHAYQAHGHTLQALEHDAEAAKLHTELYRGSTAPAPKQEPTKKSAA